MKSGKSSKGESRQQRKALIGVLASRDDAKVNRTLVSLFTHFRNQEDAPKLEQFHFVFTGGTYDRLFFGESKLGVSALDEDVAEWLKRDCGCTRLPPASEGGIVLLSYLITQRQCSIVWPFFAPQEMHWLRCENQAFMRLADQWHVKRLMNSGSVMVWFDRESSSDKNRNLQRLPVRLSLRPGQPKRKSLSFRTRKRGKGYQSGPRPRAWVSRKKDISEMTIALIAHDEMKARMIDFAIDHEAELKQFGTILATGTTGREVAAATSPKIAARMERYHSGPKGGDIEIATEILYDLCDIVVFFIDPLNPHPHLEDIRVVFQACMVKDKVVMITNEMHAREFMSRVVRGQKQLTLYSDPSDTK
jgi:methylglyoxal synthase